MNRQGIEGVPDHLKVVAYRAVGCGDHYFVWHAHEVWECCEESIDHYPVVEPDNVYGLYDLTEVKIPEGYEFVAYRDLKNDENYIAAGGYNSIVLNSVTTNNNYDQRRIIVKPIAKKTQRELHVHVLKLAEGVTPEYIGFLDQDENEVELSFHIEEHTL